MNIQAYILYFLLTYFITVHVGLIFYRNGRIFILRLLHNDEKTTQAVNNLLLAGYYLLNLGYATLMVSSWPTLSSPEDMLVTVLFMTGRILLILGFIHFMNMGAIYLYSKRHHAILHHKKHSV